MMQFSENAPPPPLYPSRPWPDLPTSSAKSSLGVGGFNNAACMEQILVHCAHAIEANDATLAQQLLWVLHNIAPPDGDSNQRLTSAFRRALLLRASRSGSSIPTTTPHQPQLPLRLSPTSLAGFIDLTPWHRFGFSAANSAIADASDGFPVLHLVDLTTTHCMQIPTLIDALASRPESPPFLRLTIPIPIPIPTSASPPPTLDISPDELGSRLVNFARSRNVGMDFRVVPSTPTDGFHSLIDFLGNSSAAGEALVINCHMMPHRVPDESAGGIPSPRAAFAKALRALEPSLVVVVDEEADFTGSDVVTRLRAAFNYMWIPFDAVETFLPAGSEQRRKYEAAVCWKIENVIAQEGVGRVERLEPRGKWGQRMRAAGFMGIGFGEEAAVEVKSMLDEHSAGWGMKRDDDDLVLTWKGHDVVFATAWIPSSSTHHQN